MHRHHSILRTFVGCAGVLALAACDSEGSTPDPVDRDDVIPCSSSLGDCPGTDTGGDTGGTGDTDDDAGDTDCQDTGDHEDGDSGDSGDDGGEADLPYDMKLALGEVVLLDDAFLEKGPLPAEVLEITMEDGGDWRLLELSNAIPFAVTQADCDHEGNRDIGRDRIFVTWVNPDGSEATDHLDLRYCEE